MNRIIITGRLTRDPEQRVTPNGVPVTTFTVACDRRFNREETDFIPVVTWRKEAENCGKYLGKGSMVGVSGSLQIRNYEKNDGTRGYVAEINADEVAFLGSKGEGKKAEPAEERPAEMPPIDDIPF